MDKYGGILRIMIDHIDQAKFLEEFERQQEKPRRWSAFIKINGGQKWVAPTLIPLTTSSNDISRAGVYPSSPEFLELIQFILKSTAVSLHGFYGHAGNSYGSTSLSEASHFLSGEVECVNTAAKLALSVMSKLEGTPSVTQPFVLAVGSTPTAHAASAETRKFLSEALYGTLELHAGTLFCVREKHALHNLRQEITQCSIYNSNILALSIKVASRSELEPQLSRIIPVVVLVVPTKLWSMQVPLLLAKIQGLLAFLAK